MNVISRAGIGFVLVRTCEGTRAHRARHQERRRRRPLLPGLHPPAPQRPLGPATRRPHPPLLPARAPRAVSSRFPCPPEGRPSHVQHTKSRGKRDTPILPRRPLRHRAPQRGGHRLAVAHRTHRPRGPGGRLFWLWSQLTVIWAALVLAAFLGIVFGLPWSRRFIMARFWCVLARHRFQRMCLGGRLHTRAGRAPRGPVGPSHQGRGTAVHLVSARVSPPRTSSSTPASCAPPATPATRGSPATPAGPSS